jgi:hypothetical protein
MLTYLKTCIFVTVTSFLLLHALSLPVFAAIPIDPEFPRNLRADGKPVSHPVFISRTPKQEIKGKVANGKYVNLVGQVGLTESCRTVYNQSLDGEDLYVPGINTDPPAEWASFIDPANLTGLNASGIVVLPSCSYCLDKTIPPGIATADKGSNRELIAADVCGTDSCDNFKKCPAVPSTKTGCKTSRGGYAIPGKIVDNSLALVHQKRALGYCEEYKTTTVCNGATKTLSSTTLGRILLPSPPNPKQTEITCSGTSCCTVEASFRW